MSELSGNTIVTKQDKPQRDSNLELFRIITMLLIVAHHYVVNSGLTDVLYCTPLTGKAIFLFVFGAWGKMGINCFMLITGYFMCQSNISLKKFVKLFAEVLFYNIVITCLFWVTGYAKFSWIDFVKMLVPIRNIGGGFTSAFLLFYLSIPFLNVLVHNMNEKMHVLLLCLCSFMYIFLETMPFFSIKTNYVSWFGVVFFIASYIRMYPKKIYSDTHFWSISSLVCIIMSVLSVFVCAWLSVKFNKHAAFYFVVDSNSFLAIATALSLFMLFKNLKISYNKIINSIAASTFGVLLIHANSDTMRQWLWRDTLKNADTYIHTYSIFRAWWILLHAILSVLGVYMVCTLIDMLRIKFVEVPFFKWWDKHDNEINACVGRFIKKFWAILKIE